MPFITTTHFPHHRLRAYRHALELLVLAKRLHGQVPHGYKVLATDLLKSSGSAACNTCEGANARTAGEKRMAYGVARKETGEAAGAAEALALLELVRRQDAVEFVKLADVLVGELTGLVKRWS